MTLEERITKARVVLMFYQPWFGQLANYLNFKINNDIDTMAVDINSNIFFNEEFVNSLSQEELTGVICHEILHLAFQHLSRMGNRNPKIWNIAGDLKVNDEIIFNQSKFKLPKMALVAQGNTIEIGKAKIVNIDTKSSEQIYEEIINKNNSEDLKDIGMDTFVIANNNSDKAKEKAGEWVQRVAVANETFKDKGCIPAGILKELKKLDTPELKWHQIITQRLKLISSGKTWKKPSKRMLPWYFPSKQKVKGLSCVVCIDSSGSMGEKELQKAITELWGLSQQFKAIKFWITCCDTELSEPFIVTTSTKKDLLNIKLKGGGGTSFVPVFDWIKKENINPDCLIYFTDLYGDFPNRKPLYQTYWITESSNVQVPFGKKIKI